MNLIDREGFFNGDRPAKLSKMARLHWPSFLVLSNGYGRFEVNPRKILLEAFGTFAEPPTETEILAYIHEYHAVYLLFLYKVNGVRWAQFDTNEKFLPRHKTASDNRSPVPPITEFNNWKSEYARLKTATIDGIPSDCNVFVKSAQDLGKASQDFGKSSLGVGVGGGVGGVEIHVQSSASHDGVFSLDNPPFDPTGVSLADRQATWFKEFWGAYWLRKAKADALKAFRAKVKTEAHFVRIMSAVKTQSAEMLRREPKHRPHAATWLRGERWNDETATNHSQPGKESSRVRSGPSEAELAYVDALFRGPADD